MATIIGVTALSVIFVLGVGLAVANGLTRKKPAARTYRGHGTSARFPNATGAWNPLNPLSTSCCPLPRKPSKSQLMIRSSPASSSTASSEKPATR